MKHPLLLLLAMVGLLWLCPSSYADDGTAGTSGVEDGTCYKNNSGNKISVEVRGTLHGDQEITVTEGSESGTGTGTPDPDGGCAESSSIDVDGEKYRVNAGGMEWQNPAGDWIDMSKTECDDDEDEEPKVAGSNSTGSLPSTAGDPPGDIGVNSSGSLPGFPF